MIETELLKQKEQEKREYPYIGEHPNGTLVIFVNEETGLCIDQGKGIDSIGTFHAHWNETSFYSFKGEIALKNK